MEYIFTNTGESHYCLLNIVPGLSYKIEGSANSAISFQYAIVDDQHKQLCTIGQKIIAFDGQFWNVITPPYGGQICINCFTDEEYNQWTELNVKIEEYHA